jgi:hypothetical protein
LVNNKKIKKRIEIHTTLRRRPRPDNGNAMLISKIGTSKTGSTSVLNVPITEMRRSESDEEFPVVIDALLSAVLLAAQGEARSASQSGSGTYVARNLVDFF